MKRRKEREFALQILYALEFNPGSYHEQIDLRDEDEKKFATEFARKIIRICSEEQLEFDGYIEKRLINWDFSRVAILDKILLRMAMAELIHCEDIPPEVTLNEIIELSKIYSTERSGKFINGILDSILQMLRKENKIKKSGRGLITKVK